MNLKTRPRGCEPLPGAGRAEVDRVGLRFGSALNSFTSRAARSGARRGRTVATRSASPARSPASVS
jgi:hypothetical protein